MSKAQDGKGKPAGPPPRVGHLDTVTGIMREMAAVYREMRRGKTDAERGCKLVYVLREMRCCLEAQELTRINDRLDALAQAAETRGYHGDQSAGREVRLPH